MERHRVTHEEMEKKLETYFEEVHAQRPQAGWDHAFANLGPQRRPRRWLPSFTSLPTLSPLPTALASLVLTVLIGGVSLLVTAPWESGAPRDPGLPTGVPSPRLAINVQETRTANGVAMTLQRIEITGGTANVRVLAVPEGYEPTDAPPGAAAQFRLDGGAWQDAGEAATRKTREGIYLEWTLPFAPPDATALELVITRFEVDPGQEVNGPWRWAASLQENRSR